MPRESFPFPMYSGLLEPKHYEKIGNSIWLFLWCISSTTKEEIREGEKWGIVMGNKPVEIDELAERFGVNRSTVKRWIKTLQDHDYIRTKRAPYGLIFSVRNSKKFDEKGKVINAPSVVRDRSNMNHEINTDGANLSQQQGKNAPSNKDIKDFTITTITDSDILESDEDSNQADPFIRLLDAYCKLNRRLDIHVRQNERTAMGKMVAGGMPIPFTIRTMELLLEEKRKREEDNFTLPNSFLYYEKGIWEAWNIKKSIITDTSKISIDLGSPSKKSKQQQEIAELDKFIEEERRRGTG